MAAATCIETVQRNNVFFVPIQRLPIGQGHRDNLAVVTATFCFQFEAKQIALFAAGEHIFHRNFYFLGRELRRHNVVLKRNDIPDVVNCFRTGDQIGLVIERPVHNSINRHISFLQHFHDCRSNQPLDIAWPAGVTSTTQRLGQFTDRFRHSGA